ncbi:MAG: extensin family protein [Rhodobacterales bacterium]|nr:MAG: extensin family protein [Rhodobacterales bacterium]
MEVPGGSPLAVLRSPRPERRPTTLPRTPAVIAPSPGGSVCGVASIKGQNLASIPGTLPGCGVTNPVRITEVAGVRLSQAATVDCTTAKALEFWTRKIAIPTVGRTGGGLARINVVVSYNCRKRIGTRSNRISEHGKGRAIDITGFTMRNGETFTVLKHWNSGTYGKILKLMHKGACGPFGTVLGPRANAAHRDHFHFDTARYRSGSYCR